MNIAICGAGIAGPTLAFWLQRFGHVPTLIEAAPSLRTGGYMIDFWGVGYDVAERMGIRAAVHAASYDLQEVRYVDGRGRTAGSISAETMRREIGDRFCSLPRGALAEQIFNAIEPAVETLFGVSVAAIRQEAGGVTVSLTDGGAREFDLLVGADGMHSQVRGLAFGPQDRFERPIGYHVAAFETSGYRPRDELAYVSYGYPGRQISRFAQRDDRTMFLFVFASEHIKGDEPRTPGDRTTCLLDVFADAQWGEWPSIREALGLTGDLYFDRVSQIVMPGWSQGRVALLGDAASCVSLVAGEGSGLAMTQAYVLAGELAGAAPDHVAAFGLYEAKLRRFVDGKQASARKFASAFTPRTALGVWARNMATRMMAIPGVPSVLVGAQMKDAFELPSYPG